MGLFDVFKKKECCICGNEVGIIGNRKLEDGNMCSKCAKKLSPWFEDRRSSTVEDIEQQLAYREKNFQELQNFKVARTIGLWYKMYIEEVNGVPTRFYVTDAKDVMEANPDIISFKDVATCVTDIKTNRNELKKKDADGKMLSYSPRRFEYIYQFQIDMAIRNQPYFDRINFQVHSSPVRVTVEEAGGGTGFGSMLFGNTINDPTYDHKYQEFKKMCEEIEQTVFEGKNAGATMSSNVAAGTVNPYAEMIILDKTKALLKEADNTSDLNKVMELIQMISTITVGTGFEEDAKEWCAVALNAAQYRAMKEASDSAMETVAMSGKEVKKCPSCGTEVTGKFCPECGTKL